MDVGCGGTYLKISIQTTGLDGISLARIKRFSRRVGVLIRILHKDIEQLEPNEARSEYSTVLNPRRRRIPIDTPRASDGVEGCSPQIFTCKVALAKSNSA